MKRWFFVIFLGLPGVVASSLLGVWQYNRLLEKKAIIAQVESGLRTPPQVLVGLIESNSTANYKANKIDCHVASAPRNDRICEQNLVFARRAEARRGDPQKIKPFIADDLNNEKSLSRKERTTNSAILPEFTMVEAQGEWTPYVFYLETKPMNGKIGFHLVQILKISPDKGVLVKRGWVEKKDDIDSLMPLQEINSVNNSMDCHVAGAPRNDRICEQNLVFARKAEARRGDLEKIKSFAIKVVEKITGQIRYPHPNFFSPENRRDQWHSVDPELMAQGTGMGLENYYILEKTPMPGITPLDLDPKLPNNHKQYMYFWFILSAIWAILTLYYTRQRN